MFLTTRFVEFLTSGRALSLSKVVLLSTLLLAPAVECTGVTPTEFPTLGGHHCDARTFIGSGYSYHCPPTKTGDSCQLSCNLGFHVVHPGEWLCFHWDWVPVSEIKCQRTPTSAPTKLPTAAPTHTPAPIPPNDCPAHTFRGTGYSVRCPVTKNWDTCELDCLPGYTKYDFGEMQCDRGNWTTSIIIDCRKTSPPSSPPTRATWSPTLHPAAPATHDDGKKHLSNGIIALIVVLVLVGCAVLTACVVLIGVRRKWFTTSSDGPGSV